MPVKPSHLMQWLMGPSLQDAQVQGNNEQAKFKFAVQV